MPLVSSVIAPKFSVPAIASVPLTTRPGAFSVPKNTGTKLSRTVTVMPSSTVNTKPSRSKVNSSVGAISISALMCAFVTVVSLSAAISSSYVFSSTPRSTAGMLAVACSVAAASCGVASEEVATFAALDGVANGTAQPKLVATRINATSIGKNRFITCPFCPRLYFASNSSGRNTVLQSPW
ncbi:hypothetical protein SDC9_156705 [bioreactor metagenome]|uniref:Uncharacterized protein n=1 Tax=bioreactor metagenome TaxID=1076179 RepID=A0A645F4Z2_9ZZZZ